MSPELAQAAESGWKTIFDPLGLAVGVVRSAGWLLARCWGLLLAGAFVWGFVVGPRFQRYRMFEEKAYSASIERLTVTKYANGAFPSWLRDHPGRRCPVTLIELTPYMDRFALWDQWGGAYTMQCSNQQIVVISPGEDVKLGTGDDIRSDDY